MKMRNEPLKLALKKKSITKKTLADWLNISESQMTSICTLRKEPSDRLKQKIANFLAMDVNVVFPSNVPYVVQKPYHKLTKWEHVIKFIKTMLK